MSYGLDNLEQYRRAAGAVTFGPRLGPRLAQGMIAQRKLLYVIKKARNGAGEITLGLHPAAKR
jgi:hypothetical protein